MIRVTVAVVATVCIAMAAVGPAGSFEALSMLERMVFSALYAGICAPIFYSLGVLTAYFCRFRKPVEMIIGLAGMSMYVAFPSVPRFTLSRASLIRTIPRLSDCFRYTSRSPHRRSLAPF